MKHFVILCVAFILFLLTGLFLYPRSTTTVDIDTPAPVVDTTTTASDPRTITVTIYDREYDLVEGEYSNEAVPGSSSQEWVRVFGEPIYGDMDNDGDDDTALMLQYSGGGTGVFYYAVVALRDGDRYRATNTMLLGDRIAPQSVDVADGVATYNYAVRGGDEPMSTPPSIGVSTRIQYDAYMDGIREWTWSAGEAAVTTERYVGQVDRVAVVFEHSNYVDYRLTTNGLIRYGSLTTERGYADDEDATVYVLNWQAPEGEWIQYVRLTDEPGRLYLLDSERRIVTSSVLTLE